jgi:c-di-GMP-related signal transduction protein
MRVKETDLFLPGVMSTMDAALGRQTAQVVCEVPLPDAMRAALLNEQGCFRDVLRIALGLERGAWKEISQPIAQFRLDESSIPGIYLVPLIGPRGSSRARPAGNRRLSQDAASTD